MRHIGHALALFGLAVVAGCASTSLETTAADSISAEAFEAPIALLSEGDTLRGTVTVAEGAGPHPTVLLLNGFEGWPEAPGAFADPVTEAGYNLVFVPYRGTWASDGEFSTDHVLADVEAMIAFLRSPEARTAYRVDPEAIALWGVSFGGWAALSVAASDPDVECVAVQVVANVGAIGRQWSEAEPYRAAWEQNLGLIEANRPIRLEGGPTGAMGAIMEGADDYDLVPLAPALRGRTILMFGAEEDEVAPFAQHSQPVADALEATGMESLTLVTAPGGHGDPRPEWTTELVRWLDDDCIEGS